MIIKAKIMHNSNCAKNTLNASDPFMSSVPQGLPGPQRKNATSDPTTGDLQTFLFGVFQPVYQHSERPRTLQKTSKLSQLITKRDIHSGGGLFARNRHCCPPLKPYVRG